MKSPEELKQEVASHIIDLCSGKKFILLGSGSTVNEVIKASSSSISFVASSRLTSIELTKVGLKEVKLIQVLDQTTRTCIDGADQILDEGKYIIKGHGGALLREKITWNAATEIIVAIDESKLADQLSKTIPVVITPFGWQSIQLQIEKVPKIISTQLHFVDNLPYNTDDGNLILHLNVDTAVNLDKLHRQLLAIPGVIETGIFFRENFERIRIICATQDKIIEF